LQIFNHLKKNDYRGAEIGISNELAELVNFYVALNGPSSETFNLP